MCVHRYDDYDYGEVNQLLERDLKLYIKAVACFPDATKTPVCPRSMVPLKPSERVRRRSPLLHSSTLHTLVALWVNPLTFCSVSQIHVNLLIMEARLQGELLYALRAITQYMIAWAFGRGTRSELSASAERERETQTLKWDDCGTLQRHRAPLFCSRASWMCFFFFFLLRFNVIIPYCATSSPPSSPPTDSLVVKSSYLASQRLCAIIMRLLFSFYLLFCAPALSVRNCLFIAVCYSSQHSPFLY